MKNGFWKTVLASGLGFLLANIVIGIIFFILVIGIAASIGSQSSVSVKDKSVLTIDLSNPMQERETSTLEALVSNQKPVSLDAILRSLNNAADDSKISGVLIKCGPLYDGGWATTQEIRNAIAKFKKSGKFVYAYADQYTQKSYFLASVADKVYLNPAGMLEFSGIAAEAMFVKDLLDKLEVKVDLVRPNSNAFKSAGEMYTMNKMSEANREQIRTYIASIWNEVLPQMSKSRNIPVARLNEIADSLTAFMAADAQSAGLVDVLGFENDVKEAMVKAINGVDKVSDLAMVSLSDYVTTVKAEMSSDKIAVIYAEGEVVQGKGHDINVYSHNISKALDEAADDDNVKAIVLRVNSPGGAVTASEIITNAVRRAKDRKPVVVSMGDLAASAGYEMSCYATAIVAQPTTITGSIGVFGMVPEVGTMLKNKLGITFDTVTTNKNSAAMSVTRPLSPMARAMWQKNVEDFYVTFCSRVAEGRGLAVEQVDSIARGRVWTGRDAIKIGLVDTLGGFDLALRIAAAKAGIKKYSLKSYPEVPTTFLELLSMTSEDERARLLLPKQYGKYRALGEVEKICTMDPLQARLPYFINL